MDEVAINALTPPARALKPTIFVSSLELRGAAAVAPGLALLWS